MGMQAGATTLENNIEASKKTKQICHMIQQSQSWGYTQKNTIQVTPEAPVQPCLLQRYS
jgi:hypothetical protein